MGNGGPIIAVEEVSRKRGESIGSWLFEWRIENRTDRPLTLLSVRLPHGKFRSGERKFAQGIRAGARESIVIAMAALCSETPGAVIENAFAILSTQWSGALWRVFVRFRVTIDRRGEPNTATELITTQRVGFSGIKEK